MQKTLLLVIVGLACSAGAVFASEASGGGEEVQSLRQTQPHYFGLTILGEALIYSISYDRVVNDNLGLGIGAGPFASGDDFFLFLPIYANIYPMGGKHFAPMITVGTTLMIGEVFDDDFSGQLGVIGVGFEHRNDFTWRLKAHLIWSDEGMLAPWPGLSLGGSF